MKKWFYLITICIAFNSFGICQCDGWNFETEIRNECTNGVKCDDDQHRFNRRTEFVIIEGPTTIQIEKKQFKKNN